MISNGKNNWKGQIGKDQRLLYFKIFRINSFLRIICSSICGKVSPRWLNRQKGDSEKAIQIMIKAIQDSFFLVCVTWIGCCNIVI